MTHQFNRNSINKTNPSIIIIQSYTIKYLLYITPAYPTLSYLQYMTAYRPTIYPYPKHKLLRKQTKQNKAKAT
jgi:hypothetical protein